MNAIGKPGEVVDVGIAAIRWPSAINWRALSTVSSLVIVAKAVGMVKAMVIARAFGSGRDLDAFYIAFMLPSAIVAIMSGSISSSFIPVYFQVKQKRGLEEAKRLFASVSFLSALVLLGCSVVLAFLSIPIFSSLTSSFDAEHRALAHRLFLWMLPVITFSGLSATWSSLLNAENRFAVAALSTAISPAVLIGGLWFFSARWGVLVLAAGTLLGALAELALLAWELRRRKLFRMPRWHGMNEDLRAVYRQFSPGVIGSVWSSSSAIVDQSMAAMLPAGSVAALAYGSAGCSAFLSIAGGALSTAALPAFSRLVALRDWLAVRRLLRDYVWLALGVGVAATLGIAVLSYPVTALLYQRGAFHASDTALVAQIQRALAIQIPAYLAAMVVVRLLAALQRNWVRTVGGIGNLILNVLLNYWLMRPFGVTGIALSTSFVCIASSAYLAFMLRRELVSARQSHE